MAFEYTYENGCQLDSVTEKLLEEIDNFQYDRLKPFTYLGEIHSNLDVHIVNQIPDRIINIEKKLGQLRMMLDKISIRNEMLAKIRRAEKKNMRERLNWSKKEYLPQLIDTRQIEDILSQHSGEPDSTTIKIPITIQRSGYYTRDKNNNGLVVLKKSNSSEMASTYVNQLMHAYFDDSCSGNMNNIEYVEEPLAEYGMLMFLEQFYSTDSSFADLFIDTYFRVKQKQNCFGIMHYGFGAELFDNFHENDWEVMLKKWHTTKTDSFGAFAACYNHVSRKFQTSWPTDREIDLITSKIFTLLQNKTNTKPTKQYSGYGWSPYIFLFEAIHTHHHGNVHNIRVGEAIIYNEEKDVWKTASSNEYILCSCLSDYRCFYFPGATESFYYCEVTKVTNSDIFISCYYKIGTPMTLLMTIDNEMVTFDIPPYCTSLFINNVHNKLEAISCQHNPLFHFDANNNILIYNDNCLVMGFNNSTIPDTVTSIGKDAFYGCTSLQNITIPNSVTSIGNFAFVGCSSLRSIVIPSSITKIGFDTFLHCSSLQNITIPDSVTSIENGAFDECHTLTTIYIPKGSRSHFESLLPKELHDMFVEQ